MYASLINANFVHSYAVVYTRNVACQYLQGAQSLKKKAMR